MGALKYILVALLLLIVAGVSGGYWYHQKIQQFADSPLLIAEQNPTFQLRTGMGVGALANELSSRGWIEDARDFRLMARLDKTGASMKAGEYAIVPGTTPRQLIELFNSGKVIQYRLTIPEGWNFKQFLTRIRNDERLIHELTDVDPENLMSALGLPEQHPEGLFFPDTYQFSSGTTDRQILLRAHRVMKEKLDAAWQIRDPNIPLKDPYEALILASIVEKETGAAHERKAIAGVFSRRLIKGMRLQTDPTVIYGIGDQFDGNITRKHLRTDTPYNTYTRKGLPPTPIALPGEAALVAAVQPEDGKALYFVAKGDGSGTHYFSATLKEHNRAVYKYQIKRNRKGKTGG